MFDFIEKEIENHMNLLLIGNVGYSQGNKPQGDKSHYIWIKGFNRFVYNKTKHKEKNIFVSAVYNALAMKKYWKS